MCGIDDENGLPAFTVPVDRATRELQDSGLVAPGVEPALVAEPSTFRVPAEIAARLAGPG